MSDGGRTDVTEWQPLDESLPLVPLRHPGRWVAAAAVLVVLGLIVRAFALGQIAWPVVASYFFAPAILQGLVATLVISVAAMVLGLALGVVFAVMRISANPVAAGVARFYIWLFRGTPVYLQLLIWFNLALIFPSIDLGPLHARMVDVMTPALAALLGLGINEGAYMTEIVRSGLLSVDRGQTEAAASIGMTHLQTMRRVVLPQAMRVIVPPFGNEFIGMLKTSAMASVIAYPELLHQAQLIYFVNARVMELLIVAAAWYLIVVSVFSFGQSYVERYFGRGQTREESPSLLRRVVRNTVRFHDDSAVRRDR